MKIQDTFKQRLADYTKTTKQLFKMLKFATDAVEEILSATDREGIVWKQVEFSDGVVLFAGAVTFPIGHQVQAESGEIVTITEENQVSMRRIIRVGLPLRLVNKEDKDAVRDYLSKHDNRANDEDDPMLDESNGEEFSTDGLTNDQVRAMLWHQEHTSKGRIN